MAKLTLTDIVAGYSTVTAYNNNNTAIEAAIENTLSRDGTAPNTMGTDLDMGSNKVVSMADPTSDYDGVNKRYGDANYGGASVIAAAASAAAAAVSEANAATSEANAATSETNAATSESNAATSEANAAATLANALLKDGSRALTADWNAGAYTITSAELIAGDPGVEDTGITVGGVTYDAAFKSSDINDTHIAHTILHRHSTTLAPILATARSHSSGSSHAVVQNGDSLGQWIAVGFDGTDYAFGGYIDFSVAATPGSGDMPTKLTIALSPDGSETPAAALTINSDKTITTYGLVTLSGDPTSDLHAATKQYVDANGGLMGNTWQDKTSSRSADTAYQNTTGKPIMLSVGTSGIEIVSSSTGGILLSADAVDGSTALAKEFFQDYQRAAATDFWVEPGIRGIVIPDQWYYKIHLYGSLSISKWWELTP